MRAYNIYNQPYLNAALFNGSNCYLDKQDLNEINAKKGVLSCWFKRLSGDQAVFCEIRNDNNLVLSIGIDTIFNSIYCDCFHNNKSHLFFSSDRDTVTANSKWRHLLVTWDLGSLALNNACQIYLDDKNIISTRNILGSANKEINFSSKYLRIGTNIPIKTVKMKMYLAQLYITLGNNFDANLKNNRREFIGSSILPTSLPSRISNRENKILFLFNTRDDLALDYYKQFSFKANGNIILVPQISIRLTQ